MMPSDQTYQGSPWTPFSFTSPAADWYIHTGYIRTHSHIRLFATGLFHNYFTVCVGPIGYRPTDSPLAFDTVVGCSSRTGTSGVLPGCSGSCRSASPPSCVIRRRGHHTEHGEIARVFTNEPATDPAGGGRNGGGYADVGGG